MVLLLGSNTSDLLSRKPECTQAFNADSPKRPQRRFGLDQFEQCRIRRIGVTTRGDPLVAQMVEGAAGQVVLGIVQRQLAGLGFVQLRDKRGQVAIGQPRCPMAQKSAYSARIKILRLLRSIFMIRMLRRMVSSNLPGGARLLFVFFSINTTVSLLKKLSRN